MKSFLFENYGFYPNDLNNLSFLIGDKEYFLIPTDFSSDEINEIEYVSNMLSNLFGIGAVLIKNRSGEFRSFDGERYYVLWSIKKGKQDIQKLMYMHKMFHNNLSNEKIILKDLIDLWEEKFIFIENKVIPTIRSDDGDYNLILEGIYFAFGLAENAIQYLADTNIDIGKEIVHNSLVHKRLNSFDNNTFFDPFNLIIDSPIRDIAELYKANQISTEEIKGILNFYNFDLVEISVLFARVLYPTRLFDVLEKHYVDRKNIKKEILDYRISIDMELLRIKNLYKVLIKRYNIRPLSWLEK